MNNLGLAIAIASEAFKNKKDKGGHPYILHCLRVMNKMHTTEEKIIAILHDVVEDTDWTFEQLIDAGFSHDVVDDLKLLTHKDEDDYLTVYIPKIATSKRATKVKRADIEDNTDVTRLKGLTKKDHDRIQKYHTAYIYLSRI